MASITLGTRQALQEFVCSVSSSSIPITDVAQESFYSQLKKLQDDDNTNLYVSNLPKEMNEHVSHMKPRLHHVHAADVNRNLVLSSIRTRSARVVFFVTATDMDVALALQG